jgi:hypothetical protein
MHLGNGPKVPNAKHKDHQGSGVTLLEDILRLQRDFRRVLQPIGVTPLQASVLCPIGMRVLNWETLQRPSAFTLQHWLAVMKDLVRKRWVTSRRSAEIVARYVYG